MGNSFQPPALWVVERLVHHYGWVDSSIAMEGKVGTCFRVLLGNPGESDILFQMRTETGARDSSGESAVNHYRATVHRFYSTEALKAHESVFAGVGLHSFMRMATNEVGLVEFDCPL